MSTRITPPPTSPGGMLFGNCQSISGDVDSVARITDPLAKL